MQRSVIPHPLNFRGIVLILVVLQLSDPTLLRAQRFLTTFGVVSEFKTMRNAHGMVSGDFNGDGVTDIVVYGDQQLRFYYQSAESLSFQSMTIPMKKTIVSAIAARCNADRFTDFVLATADPPSIQVYLSRSRGNVALAWQKNLPESFDRFLVADINNDHRQDILLYGRKQLGVMVYLGIGNGTFRNGTLIFPEYSFSTLLVTELRDGGVSDVIGTDWVSNHLLVFSGFGKLKFSEPVILNCPSEPTMIAAAYLDSDMNKDLVVTFSQPPSLTTYLADGSGGFHRTQAIPLDHSPTDLYVEDVNSDGFSDASFLSLTNESFEVFLNNGNGHLEEHISLATGGSPSQSLLFPYDKTTLVNAALLDTAHSSLRIFYQANVRGNPETEQTYVVGLKPGAVVCANVNADSMGDILVANEGSKSISLFLNRGDGTFGGHMSFRLPSEPTSLRYLSKDDTTAVLLATSTESRRIFILEINLRDFSHLTYSLPMQGTPDILHVEVDTLSRFIKLDALEYESSVHSASLMSFEQISSSRFIQRAETSVPAPGMITAAIGDYNKDGYPDVVYVTYDGKRQEEELFQANGRPSGGYDPPVKVSSFQEPESVLPILCAVDLNGDGIDDLLLNLGTPVNKLYTFQGERDSSLIRLHGNPIGSMFIESSNRIKVFDVNADGYPDIVVDNSLQKSIELFMGNRYGGVSDPVRLTSSEGVGGFDVRDLNHDHSPELVVTYSSTGIVKIIPLKE